MKVLLNLFASFLLLSCAPQQSDSNTAEQKDSQPPTVTNLQPMEMAEKMEEKQGIVLDVRTAEETESGVIQGAVHMDFYRPDFSERLQSLSKDQPVYVYCAAGGRSSEAAKILMDQGHQEVYNLEGGMGKWKQSGMPTESLQQ